MPSDPTPVQPQEELLLALVEGLVDDTGDLDGFLQRMVSSRLDSGHCAYLAEESRTGWFEWRLMKAAIANLREDGPDAMRGAVGSPLLEWALDVAEGKRTPPARPRGRDPWDNVVRDAVIANVVRRIHDELGHRPLKTSAARNYEGLRMPHRGASELHMLPRCGFTRICEGAQFRGWTNRKRSSSDLIRHRAGCHP